MHTNVTRPSVREKGRLGEPLLDDDVDEDDDDDDDEDEEENNAALDKP